jgi:hypothetical protein
VIARESILWSTQARPGWPPDFGSIDLVIDICIENQHPKNSTPKFLKDIAVHPQPQRILFLCDGKLVIGHYSVDEQGTVTATNGDRRKSTQQGNSNPDQVARWLLRELDAESRA